MTLGKKRHCPGWLAASAAVVQGLLLCAFLALPGQVQAHASLVKSMPAQRAVLARSPARIQLWFSERLEARFSSFSLLDANAGPVEMGVVELGRDDPKSLSAEVKALAAGRYVVKYRVLSIDGHVTEQEFTFTISR